ncbi:MAG: penicillin-binding protein 1C [Saprospiraceae bacterium]|nr:penicillin-binding protein 1C [Candidatus Opimibacter skivensis]
MFKGRRKYLWLMVIPVLVWWFCLPDPLFDASYSTVLLDRNEQLMGARLAKDGQWRFPGDELEVPETFEKAIVVFEDKRFFNHWGVDILAFGRAMRDNIKARSVVSGGSTLTMQTMRLARNRDARTLWQKGVEMLWAWRAELRYSKKEILQLYAAHAPFGGNVVGLGAASWRYFHKAPDQLSWGEAATLAVLPNAPGLIHPGRNRDALIAKRNRLIDKLEAEGIIDQTEASLAKDEPLPLAPHPLPNIAPHVLGHYTDAEITLHSTIDIDLQQRLAELVQRHADLLSLNGVNNAALMVMETESGEVRAYIGNVSHLQKGHQNDVDIIQSERSSGSILKPFLYCAALEEGLITPKGILEDIPTYIRGYQPMNFTQQYMGMVPADQALAMSLNVPAVRLLQQYGILPFKEKLIKAGITTLHYSPEHYGLPLVLGGAEVKLWDICGAYASMGRVLSHAYLYDHQYDKDDVHPPVLFQQGARSKEQGENEKVNLGEEAPVWDAGAIWLTFEAMSTLRRPDQEGQWETFNSSRPIAWKTGTSFGFRDAWAVGVTPKYTIGVWVGNADGEGRPGVIGLHAAAPIMFDALRMLDDDGSWWSPPYDALTPKLVCSESGWLATSSCMSTDTAFIIKEGETPASCSYHVQAYTDATQQYQYNPTCMPEAAALSNFFIVPTLAETYYKRYNPSYRSLPPLHPHCASAEQSNDNLAIIYPRPGSKIYVPFEWDKKKSRAVFSAVHRSDTALVYWTLDKHYLGKTKEFHQIEIDPKPGKHQLVLQDEYGSMVSTTFEVLNNE